MKSATTHLLIAATLIGFTAACTEKKQEAKPQANVVSGQVLGIEAGKASVADLEKFANGGPLPLAEQFLDDTQKKNARLALGKQRQIAPDKIEEALASAQGKALFAASCKVVVDSACATRAPAVFRTVAQGGSFNMLGIVKAYPGEKLTVNLLAFIKNYPALDTALAGLETAYGPAQ
jgi:hypothetical protein